MLLFSHYKNFALLLVTLGMFGPFLGEPVMSFVNGLIDAGANIERALNVHWTR